jgi:hypothetical protein
MAYPQAVDGGDGLQIWSVAANISMYRAGSFRTVAEEISKYKLDLVGL